MRTSASVVTAGFDYNFTSKFTAGLAFGADEVRVGTLAAIGPGSFNLKGLTTTLYTLWRGDRIFAEATANARKYVLLTTNTHDVLQFDLQESIAQSLLNLSVPAPKTNSVP